MKPLIKATPTKIKFYKNYTWLIFIALCILPLIDIRLGTISFISMVLGMVQSVFSKGRPYCAYFCPRGGFLQKMLNKFSFKFETPKFLTSPYVRYGFTLLLVVRVVRGLLRAETLEQMGATGYMGFVSTTLLALIIGVFFKPRTYCSELCHAGNVAKVVNTLKK